TSAGTINSWAAFLNKGGELASLIFCVDLAIAGLPWASSKARRGGKQKQESGKHHKKRKKRTNKRGKVHANLWPCSPFPALGQPVGYGLIRPSDLGLRVFPVCLQTHTLPRTNVGVFNRLNRA